MPEYFVTMWWSHVCEPTVMPASARFFTSSRRIHPGLPSTTVMMKNVPVIPRCESAGIAWATWLSLPSSKVRMTGFSGRPWPVCRCAAYCAGEIVV